MRQRAPLLRRLPLLLLVLQLQLVVVVVVVAVRPVAAVFRGDGDLADLKSCRELGGNRRCSVSGALLLLQEDRNATTTTTTTTSSSSSSSFFALKLTAPTTHAVLNATFRIANYTSSEGSPPPPGVALRASAAVLTSSQYGEVQRALAAGGGGSAGGNARAAEELVKIAGKADGEGGDDDVAGAFAVDRVGEGKVSVSWQGSASALEGSDAFYVVFARGSSYLGNDTAQVEAAEALPLLLEVSVAYVPIVACLVSLIVWAALCGCCFLGVCGWPLYQKYYVKRKRMARDAELARQHEEEMASKRAETEFERRPTYDRAQPEPMPWLETCTGDRRVPFLERQYITFKWYWTTTHTLLWVKYPHPRETLRRKHRIVVAFTLVSFELLLQTLWANIFAEAGQNAAVTLTGTSAADGTPSGLGSRLILQVASGATIATLVGFVYRPFARFVVKDRNVWGDHEKAWRQKLGVVLRYAAWGISFAILAGIALAMAMLLDEYSCDQFFWHVFLPFLLSLVWTSIFPGVIFSYIGFRILNTVGIDLGEGEHEALLR